jgi:hypothetical protein
VLRVAMICRACTASYCALCLVNNRDCKQLFGSELDVLLLLAPDADDATGTPGTSPRLGKRSAKAPSVPPALVSAVIALPAAIECAFAVLGDESDEKGELAVLCGRARDRVCCAGCCAADLLKPSVTNQVCRLSDVTRHDVCSVCRSSYDSAPSNTTRRRRQHRCR